MSERRKIYFAHPFDTWINERKREKMIKRILTERGYDVLNPFDYEDDLLQKYEIENYYDREYYEHARDIVNVDYSRVDECDEVFAWLPRGILAVGTMCEINYAKRTGKKVTILSYRASPFFLDMLDDRGIIYTSYKNFKNDIRHKWNHYEEKN